jgi:hypothetical protein
MGAGPLNTSNLMPAPIGSSNAGPPKPKEPTEEATQSAPLQNEDAMLTEPQITASSQNDKSAVAIQASLKSKEFVDLAAQGAVEALPAILQKLLEEGVISAPIVPARSDDEDQGIPCPVGFFLRLAQEEPVGQIGECYFDKRSHFCRDLVVSLNLANRAVGSYLARRAIESITYHCARLIVECVDRRQTPLVDAVRMAILTSVGVSPNSGVAVDRLAVALAHSLLLKRIAELPIYGGAAIAGRSFHLGQLDVYVDREILPRRGGRT